MKLNKIIKYSWRELLNNRFFSIFFCTNLVLGLVGFILLGQLKHSTESYFTSNMQSILGADMQIKLRQKMPDGTLQIALSSLKTQYTGEIKYTKETSFFSMISSSNYSGLFDINGIESNFPLYGGFYVNGNVITNELIDNSLVSKKGIWLDKNTANILQINLGDKLKIGEFFLLLMDLLKKKNLLILLLLALFRQFMLVENIFLILIY